MSVLEAAICLWKMGIADDDELADGHPVLKLQLHSRLDACKRPSMSSLAICSAAVWW